MTNQRHPSSFRSNSNSRQDVVGRREETDLRHQGAKSVRIGTSAPSLRLLLPTLPPACSAMPKTPQRTEQQQMTILLRGATLRITCARKPRPGREGYLSSSAPDLIRPGISGGCQEYPMLLVNTCIYCRRGEHPNCSFQPAARQACLPDRLPYPYTVLRIREPPG
jgi:hypothetical protein